MISIKKILNRKQDKHELVVYRNIIKTLCRYIKDMRKWIMSITYTSVQEVEIGSTLLAQFVAGVDIYTDCKFSRPSTIIGLRNSISTLSEGMAIFIESTFDNLDKSKDINEEVLLKSMMHGFDLLMSGTRIAFHTLEFERQQVEMNVDIIDRYYTKQEIPDSDKVRFVVKFTQPDRITGRLPSEKENNNGSNE